MDALPIARLQFATTTSFHFLFVLLTLGLVTLVAAMQTRAAIGGKPELLRMTKFWGRLYVINYALGIVTGIVMEFQANSFLQNPVGSHVENGALRLDDFGALFGNPALAASLPHVVAAALVTGGFFVVGVSAYHFLKRTTEIEFFRRSMRVSVVAALIGTILVINQGFAQFGELRMYQPDKLEYGGVGLPLGLMIMLGFVMLLCALLGTLLLFRNWVMKARFLHYLMVAAIPLPFVAAIMGWLVRELGRQPWLVYGKLRTADALADVPAGQILFSFIAFFLLFAALAIADWVLMARVAKRGPERETPAELPVLSGV